MTFGEFLLKKGAVPQDVLGSALIAQLRVTPSVAEVVWQKKLLEPEKWFAAIFKQTQNAGGFLSACKDLGTWSDQIASEVSNEMSKVSHHFIRELVDKKVITEEKLTQLFDAYLTEVGEKSSVAGSGKSEMIGILSAPSEAVTPIPQVESASVTRPETAQSAKEVSSEAALLFVEQFNELSRDLILSALSSVQDDLKRKAAGETAHRLYGAAQFSSLQRMMTFFRALESLLLGPKSVPGEQVQLLQSAAEAAWALRAHIQSCGSEAGFDQANVVHRDRLMALEKISQGGKG